MKRDVLGGILVGLAIVDTPAIWGLSDLALRLSSPTWVTTVLCLSPPVTIICSWGMFDEPPCWARQRELYVLLGASCSSCGDGLPPEPELAATIL